MASHIQIATEYLSRGDINVLGAELRNGKWYRYGMVLSARSSREADEALLNWVIRWLASKEAVAGSISTARGVVRCVKALDGFTEPTF